MNTNAKWILGSIAVVTAYGIGTGADTTPVVRDVTPVTVSGPSVGCTDRAIGCDRITGADIAGLVTPGTIMASPTQGDVVPGSCTVYTGQRTVYACVPDVSPEGGALSRSWEDGSALYTDGYTIDAESASFYR